ncbi:MAG: ferrous iron transport protein A [Thermovirgaceae bacterium]
MLLKDMNPGDQGIISKIEPGNTMQRLYDLGFFPGVRITVVRNAPFKDPIECSLDGRRVSVRRFEVEGVEVRSE